MKFKLKAVAVFFVIALTLQFSKVDASMISDRAGLDENQDWLYFMYANQDGCYFIQPSYDDENVVFVDDHNACKNEHHGKKYIGTFVDTDFWELVHIEKYVSEKRIQALVKKLKLLSKHK